VVLQLSKPEFFTTLLGFVPSTTATTNLDVMLSRKESIGTANAGAGVNVGGGGVTFATGPNNFVTDSGAVVSGNVTITVSVIDPADSNFGIAAPGGDLLGTHPAGGDGVLGSNGMVFVGAQTASGAAAHLAPGADATVTIPAGEAPVGKIGATAAPPDSVGLWELGTNGIWVRTGTAYLSGSRYSFTATKLGVFNCGRIVRWALVRGTLCGPGLSSSGEQVKIGLLTTQTDAGGRFALKVPADDTLFARTRFGSAVIGPFTQGTTNTITLDFCDTVRVQILSPANGSTVTTSPVQVMGTVNDHSLTSGFLIVNGTPQTLPITNGAFAGSAALTTGTNLIRVEVPRTGRTSVADQVVVTYLPTFDSSFVRWTVGQVQYTIVPSDTVQPYAVLDTVAQQLYLFAQAQVGLFMFLQPVQGTGTWSLGDFDSDTTSWAIYDTDTDLGTPASEYVTTPNFTGRATISSIVPGSLAPGTVAGTFSFNAGLLDSVLAGSQQIPSVGITGGAFRVPLIVTGSGRVVSGMSRLRAMPSMPAPSFREVPRLRR
jgi:hypothetical protein